MINYLLLASGLFTFYWASKTQNRLTKFTAYMLGLSIFMGFISFGGINKYAPYAFAFFSLFAGFEPMGSFRFKNRHKTIFVYCGITSMIVSIMGLVTLPFEIPAELFMLPIPFLTIWLWRKEKKVIYQRVGFLLVWSAQAVIELFNCLWVRGELAEFF